MEVAIVNYGILQSYVPTAARPALDLAWTIVTEMSFYLVLPLYAVIVGRGERTAPQQVRRELIALAMLVLVSIAWRSYFAWGTPPQRFHWYASQNDV
jgi:peptidoglycan/LPS O-acetylase OafA/YrhL